MAFKYNNSDNYESITIIISKELYPILFQNKVDELLEQKVFNSRSEAEKFVEGMEIELELYYEKHYGLFGVEAQAIESEYDISSPYSREYGTWDDN